MTTVQDVPAEPLILKAAEALRDVDELQPPEWAGFARTGPHRERPPEQDNWWWIRSAAVLRQIYLNGPIGTERLAAHFGGKRDRGVKPYKAVKGSRSVIRTVLQQLEAAGYAASDENNGGRRVTPEGQRLLDNLSNEVRKEIEDEVPGLAKY